MGTGYRMLHLAGRASMLKLHPPGGLYRCAMPSVESLGKQYPRTRIGKTSLGTCSIQTGDLCLLLAWVRPDGISAKSPLLNAHFLVGDKKVICDISYFRYLKLVE